MAKSISDEELQLRKRARRRLVGAIALVTITAVFLPMVLDHEPKPVSQDVSIQIPSPNSGAFTSKIVPLAPNQKSAPASIAKPEVAAEAPAQAAAPAASEAPKAAVSRMTKPAEEVPPVTDTEAAPPLKAAAEKSSPAAPAEKPKALEKPKTAEKGKAAEKSKARAKGAISYIVQVAALNDTEKAKQIRDQLAAAGVKVYTEIVPTPKGNVTRVRAGPFASHDEAEKARDKLKGMGLNGNVLPK